MSFNVASLENQLSIAQMPPEVDLIIQTLNKLVKSLDLSLDQKDYLKKLRQKAYDRKRALRILMGSESIVDHLQTSADAITSVKEDSNFLKNSAEIQTDNQIVKKDLRSSEKNLRDQSRSVENLSFPCKILIVIANFFVSYLVWLQSVDLYKSTFFKNSEIAATGAICMVVAFAAYYSLTKSKFALLLCFYAGSYEGYFMVTATMQDENLMAMQRTEESPEVLLLKEKMEKGKDEYLLVKGRYETLGSKVYKNDWYKKNFLTPALKQYEESTQEYVKKKEEGNGRFYLLNVILLKIFYRVGLVLMAMVLIHYLVGVLSLIKFNNIS